MRLKMGLHFVMAAGAMLTLACSKSSDNNTPGSSQSSSFTLVKTIDVTGYRLAKMGFTGNYLLVLGSVPSGLGYLHTIDLSGGEPQYLAVNSGGGVNAWGGEFVVDGNYAYQVGWCCRFNSFDISNPAAIVRDFDDTDNPPLGAGLTSIQVQGNYAFIAGQVTGAGDKFYVVDKSNAADLDIMDDMFVTSSYLYITNINSKTVQIFSLADPANPALITTVNIDSPGKAVFAANGTLYVAAGDYGGSSAHDDYLYAFSLTDYSLQDRISIGNWPSGLIVKNGFIAVTVNFGQDGTDHVEFYRFQ